MKNIRNTIHLNKKARIVVYKEMQRFIDDTVQKGIDVGLDLGQKLIDEHYEEYCLKYSSITANRDDMIANLTEDLKEIVEKNRQSLDLFYLYNKFKEIGKEDCYNYIIDCYADLLSKFNPLNKDKTIIGYIDELKKMWVNDCFVEIERDIKSLERFAKIAAVYAPTEKEYKKLIMLCQKRIGSLLYSNLTSCWHSIVEEILDSKEAFEIMVSEIVVSVITDDIIKSCINLLPVAKDLDEDFCKVLDTILHKASLENPRKDVEQEVRGNYKYIENPIELSSLAQDKGYTYERSNGDHAIYKNKDGLVVIIPQGRNIGKGLSIRIQKDIDR